MAIMKEKKSLPVYISQASFGKEIGAFAIDALLALVLGTVIRYTLGSYVIAPAAGYNEAKEAYYSLAEASGLYERNDGNLQLISYEGKGEELYNHYRDLNNTIWHYYFYSYGINGIQSVGGGTYYCAFSFTFNDDTAGSSYAEYPQYRTFGG